METHNKIVNGDWWFDILENGLETFDLAVYQQKLKQIRESFSSKLKSKSTNEIEVFWNPEYKDPPYDNIFASFHYQCSLPNDCLRHNSGHRPGWYLYWNPKRVPKENRRSDLNLECSNSEEFTKPSIDIQKMLIDELPKLFQLSTVKETDGQQLNFTILFYEANKGFIPTPKSSLALRSMSMQSTRTQNGNVASSSTQQMESTLSSMAPATTQSTSETSSATSSGSNDNVTLTGTIRDRIAAQLDDYIATETQDLTEEEQRLFRASTAELLRNIKRARQN